MNNVKKYHIFAIILLLIFCFLVPDIKAATFTNQDVDKQLEALKKYEYQIGTNARTIEAIIRQCQNQSEFKQYVEQQMLKFLESDATIAAKQFICKQLWIIGTQRSVPTLHKMLEDEKTVEMACYALRSNNSAEAGRALRQALESVADNSKVIIINLLGERRDEQSVPILSNLLLSDNEIVSESAAAALGKIGGVSAIKALDKFCSSNNPKIKAVATEAKLRYADLLVLQGRNTKAMSIYNKILNSDQKLFRRSALLGIMSIGDRQALSRVISILYGDDQMLKHTAIANSHRFKTSHATKEFVAQLPRLQADEQSLLIYALADRGDVSVRPAITKMLDSPCSEVRQAVLKTLGDIGDTSSVKLLCKAVSDSQSTEEKNTALVSLRRMSGTGVDIAIIEAMKKAEPLTRVELIKVLGDRRAINSVAALLDEASNSNNDVCKAAFRTLGKLAGEKELPILLERFLSLFGRDHAAECRTEAERAIIAVANKINEENLRADKVLVVLENERRIPAKCSLLRILGGIANEKALKPLQLAIDDEDEQVRDTAIRELAAWPNAKAINILLGVLEKHGNESYRILAFRGYVRLVGLPSDRSVEETLAMYEKALKFAKRPEEKIRVLSGLSNIASPLAIKIIEPYLTDETVASEAVIAKDKIINQIKQANKKQQE